MTVQEPGYDPDRYRGFSVSGDWVEIVAWTAPSPPVVHKPTTGTADTSRTGAQPLAHARVLKIVNDVERAVLPGTCRRLFPSRLRPLRRCRAPTY